MLRYLCLYMVTNILNDGQKLLTVAVMETHVVLRRAGGDTFDVSLYILDLLQSLATRIDYIYILHCEAPFDV